MPESTAPARWRSRLLFALYTLLLLGIAAGAAGTFIGRRIRAQVASQAEIRGSWLIEDTRDGRMRLAKHGETHLRSLTYGLAFDVYTDARGLRVAGPGVETPARADLLLVGESFLFGWGVNHGDSIAGMLQEATGLRVANAAVPAAGTLGAARSVPEFADLQPRWIAYGIIDSHLQRNVCPCVPGAMTPLCIAQEHVAFTADGRPYLHPPIRSVWAPPEGTRRAFQTIVQEPQWLAGSWWAVRMVLGALYRQQRQPCVTDLGRQEQALDLALGELAAAARAANAELIVLYIPDLDREAWLEIPGPTQLVLARHAGEFTVLDLTDDVKAHRDARGANLRLEQDYHPSRTGHRLMARRLCLQLAASTPDAPSCDALTRSPDLLAPPAPPRS